jgi:hypothetical protein
MIPASGVKLRILKREKRENEIDLTKAEKIKGFDIKIIRNGTISLI